MLKNRQEYKTIERNKERKYFTKKYNRGQQKTVVDYLKIPKKYQYFENPTVYKMVGYIIFNVGIVHHIVWLYCRKNRK
jgi:hypothetical protein